jgi:hypothetical protein
MLVGLFAINMAAFFVVWRMPRQAIAVRLRSKRARQAGKHQQWDA